MANTTQKYVLTIDAGTGNDQVFASSSGFNSIIGNDGKLRY